MPSKADQKASNTPHRYRFGKSERDFVSLGIATAAVIMFVGHGSAVVPSVIASLTGYGIGPDRLLVNALLLNIALIIFGWRRYHEFTEEVGERRLAEEQAWILAETDPLTGTLNRRSIGRALDKRLIEEDGRDKCLAIMMIDLDNFKCVNDINGHGVGDQVLIECSQRIAKVLPEGSLLSRIGGDEFACAVSFRESTPDSVDKIAAAIIEAISAPSNIEAVSTEITGSIGLTSPTVPRQH